MENRQRVLQDANTISNLLMVLAACKTLRQRGGMIQSLNSYAKQNWLPTANKLNQGIVHSVRGVGLLYFLMSGGTCGMGA